MKIIIDLDAQSEKDLLIQRVADTDSAVSKEQSPATDNRNALDAGSPKTGGSLGSGENMAQAQMQTSENYAATGALNAGAAKVAGMEEDLAGTTVQETAGFDKGNAFSAGELPNMPGNSN